MRARVVNQDAAHHLRSHAEEMCAVLPGHLSLINQTQVSLMDQGRGLQCVIGAFASEIITCQTAEFAIDEWNKSSTAFCLPLVSSIRSWVMFSAPDSLMSFD